jgi:hypothetical protein
MRLEELGQLKNPMISSGFDPATFRLVLLTQNSKSLFRECLSHIKSASEGICFMEQGAGSFYL